MRGRGELRGDVEYRSAGQLHRRLLLRRRSVTAMPAIGWSRSTVSPPIRPRPTTPVCCPSTIVEPVVNFIDIARPLVSAIGTTRPRHRVVGLRQGDAAHPGRRAVSGEGRDGVAQDDDHQDVDHAADLRRLRQRFSAGHFDRTSPQILDMVIADLAVRVRHRDRSRPLFRPAGRGHRWHGARRLADSADEIAASCGPRSPSPTPTSAVPVGCCSPSPPATSACSAGCSHRINPTNAQCQGSRPASFGSGTMGTISGHPGDHDAGVCRGRSGPRHQHGRGSTVRACGTAPCKWSSRRCGVCRSATPATSKR